jgi:hypothetical protein
VTATVVVLAGGSPHAHDFVAIGAALVSLVAAAGHEVRPAADPDEAAALLDDADAVMVDGLWWRMLGDAYEPWRHSYGYSPPPATRERLTRFVAEGGGLVALHSTSICFDDWPEWGDVVGGSWRWGTSSHPPYGPVSASCVAEHPVIAGVPTRFQLVDEVYGDLDLRPGLAVLAVARRHDADADQPVVWAHRFGRGRVVYDGFGHDVASIGDQVNGLIITQALAWVIGAADA